MADQQAYPTADAAFPDNQGGGAFQTADAINPHYIEPGSVPSFAGRNPDTRGDARYPRPPLQPVPGSGSFTGKVG